MPRREQGRKGATPDGEAIAAPHRSRYDTAMFLLLLVAAATSRAADPASDHAPETLHLGTLEPAAPVDAPTAQELLGEVDPADLARALEGVSGVVTAPVQAHGQAGVGPTDRRSPRAPFLSHEPGEAPPEVEAVVRRSTLRMQRCVDPAWLADPALAGRVEVGWTVADGAVVEAQLLVDTMGVGACIVGVVRTLAFPAGLDATATWAWLLP